MPSPVEPATTVSKEQLSRADVVSLLGKGGRRLILDACTLQDVDLSRLDLGACEFAASVVSGCHFAGASLRDSRWHRCRAGRTDFGAADLVDAQFLGCDLNNTRWRRAKISATLFQGCKLTGADFTDAGSLVPPTFEESLLVGSNLQRMSFRKAQLRQLDFSDADLSACDFREATLIGGSLRGARLTQARFEGADLREAELGGLKLADLGVFKGATISARHAAELLQEFGIQVI